MDAEFLQAARATYVEANAGTLAWMLDRPRLRGVFLNTKQNSLTLRDYGEADSWRGPAILYGWIQGRGLEALVTHARFFERECPALAARLIEAAHDLYGALAALHARHGRAFFSYDGDLRPVYPGPGGEARPQHAAEDVATYSDIFVLKGLVAASAVFEPAATARYLDALDGVVQAIEGGRFVMDERQPLDRAALDRQPDEYGPRMIMLGAACLLRELGFANRVAFGGRFIDHVLRHHVENGSGSLPAGAARDRPSGDHCNPGHAIEFVGFALEVLPEDADRALVRRLEEVLLTAFTLGFASPGIRLGLSLSGATPPSEYRPWWSLPEAVRAAARCFERTGNREALGAWRTAHEAFFSHYWRSDPPIAYQTLTAEGPIDFVPATPDLDPGYHTGLSFLGAIHAIDRLQAG
jgi:hypothetical protein